MRNKLLIILFSIQSAFAITWQEQAERLQKVSAAITEAAPVSGPVLTNSFDTYTEVSVISKLDTTVGTKSENIDTPPLHSVPSIRYNYLLNPSTAVKAWVGYLPSQIASLASENEINQFLIGTEVQFILPKGLFIPLGYQLSSVEIEGNITSNTSLDTMNSLSSVVYSGIGQNFKNLWYSFTIGMRRNESKFYIEEDQTTLRFIDTGKSNGLPFYYQANVAYRIKDFSIAVSQLYIPNRILTPKISFNYQW